MGDTSKTTNARIYAIHYLDNGGKAESFPRRHKDLYNAIQQEYRRRINVEIRYKMDKERNFKKKIYKKFRINSTTEVKPVDLYNFLVKLSTNQLLLLLHGRKGV